MTEQGITSSMTSVTEEDSTDESDTTESSYSLAVSSVISSDYSTDDKLTPGLTNISISNMSQNCAPNTYIKPKSSGHTNLEEKSNSKSHDRKINSAVKPGTEKALPPVFPYGCNPLPLSGGNRNNSCNARSENLKSSGVSVSFYDSQSVNDPESDLSTDSSGALKNNDRRLRDRDGLSGSINESGTCSSSSGTGSSSSSLESQTADKRPFHPDLTSSTWFKARCFDQYWGHYNFVMEWYQAHLRTVGKLSRHLGAEGANSCAQQARKQHRSHRARKARQSKRARNRRLAKERFRNGSQDICSVSGESSQADAAASHGLEPNEDEVEMELTEEMLQFFAESHRHRLERDSQRNNSEKKEEEKGAHLTLEQVPSGHQAPTAEAPSEQPGVRRSAELKYLYGNDAPMIHGMETALQLTFDRNTDRHQPKLWPNMPLKINFA